jgi:hypothetical protein
MTCKTCRGSTFVNFADCPDCQLDEKSYPAQPLPVSAKDVDQSFHTTISNSPTVTIELSEEDAALLIHFSRNIGGSPAGPRGIFDRINEELSRVNIKPNRKQWHIDSFGHGIDVRWAT